MFPHDAYYKVHVEYRLSVLRQPRHRPSVVASPDAPTTRRPLFSRLSFAR